jgi:plastocyanin
MRRIIWFMAIALTAGVLLAAGCGDDEDEGGNGAAAPAATETPTEAPTEAPEPTEEGGGGGEALTLTADPGGAISWEPNELNAAAGSVTIELINESSTPHAVEVEGNGVEEESETITGSTTELTVDLEAGEYVFYCPVGQHRQAGMEGQLLVE